MVSPMEPKGTTVGKNYGSLEVASLFPEAFSIDWLMELTQMKPSAILCEMESAISSGTLVAKGAGEYRFANQEHRAALQNTLDITAKERLHNAIADLTIRDLPEGPEKCMALAHHLLHTTNKEENCRWLLRAGNLYLKDFRLEQAQRCYAKVLEDIECSDEKHADSLFIETAINYSKVSTSIMDNANVNQALLQAMGRARRRNDRNAQALIKMHLAKHQWMHSNFEQALQTFSDGWTMAEDIGDPKLIRSASTFGCFFQYWQGKFREAVHHYEKSVSEVDRHPNTSFPLLAGVTVALCYANVGQVSQGLGMGDNIRKRSLEIGDMSCAAYAGGTIGIIMMEMNRLEDALSYFKLALEVTKTDRDDWLEVLGDICLAQAYYLNGDVDRSLKHLRSFVHSSKRRNVYVRQHPFLLNLAWDMELGKYPRVEGVSFEKELKHILGANHSYMKGIGHRYEALMLKRERQPNDKILNSLEQSVRWLEDAGHQVEAARSRLELARLHLMLGDEAKGKHITMQASNVLSSLNEAMVPHDLRALIDVSHSREDQLREILKLGQDIVTIRENKDLVQKIISTVNRLSGAERGAIFLLDEQDQHQEPVLRASKNLTKEQTHDPEFESSLVLIKKVAATGKPIISGNSSGNINENVPNDSIRSRICVPMLLRSKVVGVLYHDNRLLSSAFRESDLELLDYFASQAAFALDNAKAYQEIRRLNEKLTEEKLYYEEQHLKSLHFENIVGESQAIKKLLAQVEQVATTDATVLILGETGVGKELVASAIHKLSPRHAKPFIRANCSALTETLITSELFGHEKGAFTGAVGRRIGRFELADGGTIFLDEIGDLPLDVQVRLLRVLQSGEFERVGGRETLRPDFRLVAATNLNLEQAVANQNFRADLYYRLNVFPLYVPPLRERMEDVAILANYFLRIYSQKIGRDFKGITDSEMDKLMNYHWPGNVRELENIIERGAILSMSSRFRVPELGGNFPGEGHGQQNTTLAESEKRTILVTLQKTNWKVRGPGGAAELLDINPSTLAFRMKKLGIQRPPKYSRGSGDSVPNRP